ncbi:MAG TPA: tetratricopeptide repeat protein [Bacteroidales bacterium]|nr:tetratricopeptide repeat protein [Bacteroidales bacterium]
MHHRIRTQWLLHSGNRRALPLLIIIVLLTTTHPVTSFAQTADPVQTEQDYTVAIKKADQYFEEGKYDRALYEFETARKLKPGEKYPQERIKGIKEILDDQKTKNILFEVAVTSAEKWFKAADYRRAKAEFENALRIDPTAQYPKDRLAQINKIWSDPEVDAKYAAAILHADDLFAQKRYLEAKGEYLVASDLKPYEQYPIDRIIAINEILAKLQLLQDQYNSIIAKADGQYDNKEYASSRSTYQDASNIKPEEAYPKNRIKEIDDILARLKAERDAYDRIVALADEYYLNKDFENARIEYEKALAMKPSETYARNMIARIDPQLAEMQRVQSAYDLTVTNATTLLQKNDYAAARAMFEKASVLKPAEALPKDKIAEIDRILNNIALQSEKEQQYVVSIARADSLFAASNLPSAKSYYEKALTYKPEETYPRQKIEEIDRHFADVKAQEDTYAQAIAEGDSQFALKVYEDARSAYQKASGIKPAESYPKEKIAEIDRILSEMTRIQKEYDLVIARADQYFTDNEYSKALTDYQKAHDLKPEETYPQEQLSKINQILEEIRNLEASYASHIASGDELLAKKDYPGALSEYQQALTLKPDEIYPGSKISDIEGILANIAASDRAYQQAVGTGDSLLSVQSYAEAITAFQNALKIKPEEDYPQQKIEEIVRIQTDIKATEETYQKAIAQGDKLLAQQSYAEARSAFVQAREIKPAESYPRQKIDEIDLLLSDLKAKEDAYAQAIAEGDSQFTLKVYEDARSAYQKASGIKPAESYPKEKIAEIDRILSEMARIQKEYETALGVADEYFNSKDYTKALTDYQKAQSLKPAETYPPEQIAKINQILEEIRNLEASYASHIDSGDELLAKKEYQDALNEYRAALALKPAEAYPEGKVSEIEEILAAISARQKAYDDAIAKADGLFNGKEYERAKQAYQDALVHDPGQSYPQEQIERISSVLRDLEVQKSFDAAIAEADQFFGAKNYDKARTEYQKAINIKPGENYPKSKIDEINSILAANEQARLESYNKAIEAGDSFFALQDHKSAKVQYQNAISIDPGQQYPKDKLKQVEQILLDKEMELKKAYQDAVAKADNLYTQKILDEAIDAYMTAHEIKNDEVYPLNMINQIKKYIADHAIVDILNSSVIISNNTERKFDFIPVDIRQRKNNYIVMKARVLSETKPKVYLNYGREATRSGGIVLKSIKDNELNDYIIRVSAQDPWYRIDNSWLKLYSEGGDIEVTYIQISTAD